MKKVKIGIIKEGKIPVDRRVPLSPKKAVETMQAFPHVQVVVEPCPYRCFADAEYTAHGIPLQTDLSDCDILLGVKEVPVDHLIPYKTYLFFSHTIKQQPKNAGLLRAILDKHITLVDYETLTNAKGERLVAFGRYAGIVGAYNAILTYARKWNLFELKPAWQCHDMDDMREEFFKVRRLPPIKIAVTGGGRVAGGVKEVLDEMGIRQVSVFDYLYKSYNQPVYTQLRSSDYHTRPDVEVWDSPDFYANPHRYVSTFGKFARSTDLLIAGAFWHPAAPRLFTEEDMRRPDFRINTIADITCDMNGSIPSTKRSSTIPDPVYDYNPQTEELEPPYSRPGNITVMAVDNLPCELPRNASRDFGRDLIDDVFPHLLGGDPEGVIARATIAKDGHLTERFQYLADYVAGERVAER